MADLPGRLESMRRRFTWFRRLSRNTAPQALAILLLSYALGFVLPTIGAIQSLVAAPHGTHATTVTDSIAAEMINDAIPLAFSLLAATLGMRSAARPPLSMRRTDLGLRRTAITSRGRAGGTTLM